MASVDTNFLRDFLSCMSCPRLISIIRSEDMNSENMTRHDQRMGRTATFHSTVCYSCEVAGVAVPARQHDDFVMRPTMQQSASTIESSVKFKAARKMVEHTLGLKISNGRVTVYHRDDILHNYSTGCKIVTITIYESVDETAVESAYMETGFF